ncbi:MAG: Tim44-like domain-containing protein [Pseudomonadota bacterium]|nr:Tim44-like domain-containing protein [Pseudomonadota bacterium]MDP1905420.1 Tim44-like domain-containing protein [Pseudomonadota bacterium]MDP2354124.1 Tim44-like domain-containing protein [Pseudomonadota bacterium]
MQRLFLSFFAVFLSFALPIQDAEAKRLGGGKSYGMQRDAPMKRDATPSQSPNQAQNAAPNAAGAAAQTGKRSWMGPLAGLAAGLGLAALASHLGFGEEMANMMMIALLALAAFMLFRWFMRRNQPAQVRPVQYAGAAAGSNEPVRFDANQPLPGSVGGMNAGATPVSAPALPPGFDAEGFVRQAKVNFLRLQAANDAGNLDDIREFTAPEMYAEIKLDIDERNGATQRTEVVSLNAEVLEATEEGNRQIVSVRFHGMLREEGEQTAHFDETWHLTRPTDASRGWLIAGIQQNA